MAVRSSLSAASASSDEGPAATLTDEIRKAREQQAIRRRGRRLTKSRVSVPTPLEASKRKQLIDRPLAVGEGVHADAGSFEQGEVKIGERGGLRVLDVAATLDPA